jgi:multicomponent K+:H+ antiporter subunit D
LIAYSRAGSVVFWRNIEGGTKNITPVTPLLAISTGALIGMSVLMVALAGPISAYTNATAAQLLDTRDYIQTLQATMVEEGS